ncbi:MAG: hypothetical protein FKGGLIKP_00647 [Sodalis sp. Fse]|nr:MAG: hypothetical protein FKGGLIKP_00647 [Sodalis sp. Fse]UVK79341.1 MAG: hypothetical protein IGNPGNKH_00837 [Sodalis sp. Ffu]
MKLGFLDQKRLYTSVKILLIIDRRAKNALIKLQTPLNLD